MKLASLKPRREASASIVAEDDMKFDDMILEAAKSIANATAALIKAASEAQKELVAQGKVQKKTFIGSEDGQWSEGLVSAARMVAAATHSLCEAANSLVQGNSSEEKLIAAAKQVSAATAQLLLACKVKADPNSQALKRLENASNAVRRATENLVKAAQVAIKENEEEDNPTFDTSAGSVRAQAQYIEIQEEVLQTERKFKAAQEKLKRAQVERYKMTDSETEHSGYESSGYDYAPTFSSYRQVYTSSPNYSHTTYYTESSFNKSNGSTSTNPNES